MSGTSPPGRAGLRASPGPDEGAHGRVAASRTQGGMARALYPASRAIDTEYGRCDEQVQEWIEADERERREAARRPARPGVLAQILAELRQLRAEADAARPTPVQGPTVEGCGPADVADRLGVDRRTLGKLVERAQGAGIVTPLVEVGGGRRRREVWDANRVRAWFEEVSRWQQFAADETSSRSDGGRRPGASGSSGASPARRGAPRRSSSGRSTTRSTSTATGNRGEPRGPLSHAKSLISGR